MESDRLGIRVTELSKPSLVLWRKQLQGACLTQARGEAPGSKAEMNHQGWDGPPTKGAETESSEPCSEDPQVPREPPEQVL